ncbi:hypothetical protein [Rhodohalobacter sp.]|uniref:hypothetical protein n=1 Tax=Rhodohalobacter sp. TaxID=1974210 RepID=UPI002ACD4460|nr:hypothetical protein [Rhodohalobacter sp.]MDZ7757705.1 hypothetical protein [Rhodohalobacter sp.]
MVYRDYLKITLKLIAIITIISGLVQMLSPGFVLGFIGGVITDSTLHFFAIIGMFMVMFGGLLLHALSGTQNHPVAVLWCSLQKYGAAVAVSLGVINGLFSWLAVGVALFDLFSGILITMHWYGIIRK